MGRIRTVEIQAGNERVAGGACCSEALDDAIPTNCTVVQMFPRISSDL